MLCLNPMRKHVIFYITSVLILSSLISTLNTYKCSQRRADSNPDTTFIGFGIFHYHAIASSIFEQFLCFHSYSHCLLFHRPSPFFHVLASISCKTDSPSDDFFGLTRTIKGRESNSSVFILNYVYMGGQILPLMWAYSSSREFCPLMHWSFMPCTRKWIFLYLQNEVGDNSSFISVKSCSSYGSALNVEVILIQKPWLSPDLWFWIIVVPLLGCPGLSAWIIFFNTRVWKQETLVFKLLMTVLIYHTIFPWVGWKYWKRDQECE